MKLGDEWSRAQVSQPSRSSFWSAAVNLARSTALRQKLYFFCFIHVDKAFPQNACRVQHVHSALIGWLWILRQHQFMNIRKSVSFSVCLFHCILNCLSILRGLLSLPFSFIILKGFAIPSNHQVLLTVPAVLPPISFCLAHVHHQKLTTVKMLHFCTKTSKAHWNLQIIMILICLTLNIGVTVSVRLPWKSVHKEIAGELI